MRPLGAFAVVLLLSAQVALAQRGVGEVHLRVTDASGSAVAAAGTIQGEATQVSREFVTDDDGTVVLAALPPGRYQVTVRRDGFAPHVETVDVESSIPLERELRLQVAPIQAAVTVAGDQERTLLNPTRTGSVRYLGAAQLAARQSALPGRSLIDLVATQPGWLLEANGILHARGSEYQIQHVIDGIPVRDNRSPAFAQSLGVNEFDSIAIRTGGYPAEFGGKLGGVIELNTARDTRPGFHGFGTVQFGSFSTSIGHGSLQYGSARTRAGVSVEGLTTNRYLDPPTEDNFANEATGGGLAGRLEHAWNDGTRTRAYVYGRSTSFDVPNELLQNVAGQHQERTAGERLGQVAHQQVLTPNTLMNVGFMSRWTDATLTSNPFSTPIHAEQDRDLRESYVGGSVIAHRGSHEIKVGGEAIFGRIEERFASSITARTLGETEVFDDDLPAHFSFHGEGDLREQGFFAQDLVRLGRATVSAGLRYDHYRLAIEEHAWSPRVSGSWLVERFDLVLHGSYDRTFETQPLENILIASTDLSEEFGDESEFRPLRPSRGHFLEGGASFVLGGRARVESTVFRRQAEDVTDDELLLNTAVSFPIAFASATVKGFELALDVPRWGALSGALSYSYSKGVGKLPLTGGLFLDVDEDELTSDEEFPLSQDQRHTLRGRLQTSLGARAWLAGLLKYDSGLPVEAEGEDEVDEDRLAEQFGDAIVDRVDFEAGRVEPSISIDLSLGVRLFGEGARSTALQLDVFNVFDRLNVINFAGLLSGTAIAPARSFAVRLQTSF